MSPPSARVQLWRRLVPNFLEVRARRKYVLRAWFVATAGVLLTKFWPVIRALWNAEARDGFFRSFEPLLFVVSGVQVVIAFVVGGMIVAKLEGEGSHDEKSAKARDERWRKQWLLYLMGGAGAI